MEAVSVYRRRITAICCLGAISLPAMAAAELVSPGRGIWLAVLVTVSVVIACISLHYEVFNGLSNLLVHLHTRPRSRILLLILGLLALHILEVWIFAAGYYFLANQPSLGGLSGPLDSGFLDYVYYSAVVYTTLGFGDLIPYGNIRFLTGTEALLGLMLITWSASFTFLEMQRFWNNR